MSGRIPIFSRKCATCVFRPGNPMRLRPGRLREIVDHNLRAGALLPCHDTTHGQAEREVMCRGFYDAHGHSVNVVRVMQRIAVLNGHDRDDWYEEVDPA